MKTIKVAVIGTGFIGPAHVEAIRRLGYVEVAAIVDTNEQQATKLANDLNIPRVFTDYKGVLADPEITAIHNCTPNHLHYQINREAILAGKHIMSEKPLALTSAEATDLVNLARKQLVVNGVNFNYRQFPLVKHLKETIAQGELGDVRLVHGNYLQDWLMYDTDFNWRMMPEVGGKSRAVADIGSHWIDVIQTVIGQNVVEVCADLATVLPTRKRLTSSSQTFGTAVSDGMYEEVEIRTEDYASILLRFDNGVRGALTVSQVSPGRRNHLSFEIDCSKASASWNQEEPHRLWIGHRGRPNEIIMADPTLVLENAAKSIHYPGGHNEGWPDALKNSMSSFYEFIRDGKDPLSDPRDFADFEDGLTTMRVTDAILESQALGRWVSIKRDRELQMSS